MPRILDLDASLPAIAAIVEEVAAGGEIVAMTRDGEPAVVIVSFADYDLLVRAVQQLAADHEG